MIDNKTEIEVSYHAKRTVTSGTQIGLSFEQISNMVKGAVGVDGNTLGFGMPSYMNFIIQQQVETIMILQNFLELDQLLIT